MKAVLVVSFQVLGEDQGTWAPSISGESPTGAHGMSPYLKALFLIRASL